MYNDYYLQEISNKLDDIEENQEAIIQSIGQQISGDNLKIEIIKEATNYTIIIAIILSMTILYTFITRCFK